MRASPTQAECRPFSARTGRRTAQLDLLPRPRGALPTFPPPEWRGGPTSSRTPRDHRRPPADPSVDVYSEANMNFVERPIVRSVLCVASSIIHIPWSKWSCTSSKCGWGAGRAPTLSLFPLLSAFTPHHRRLRYHNFPPMHRRQRRRQRRRGHRHLLGGLGGGGPAVGSGGRVGGPHLAADAPCRRGGGAAGERAFWPFVWDRLTRPARRRLIAHTRRGRL